MSEKPFVNILLLGESGQGKSTFINSFANYLKHDTYSSALQDGLEYLIPSEFEIKVKDNSKTATSIKVIKTREVTDYKFDAKNVTIRLIDTPGDFETHKNMPNIKQMVAQVAKYGHVNAFAFVIKCHHASLRSYKAYVSSLLSHFNKSTYENVVFILTHSCCTDYISYEVLSTSTWECLKENGMETLSSKSNTFEVDNLGFKYLVAHFKGFTLPMNDLKAIDEYWIKSVMSCRNLINYIVGDGTITGLKPHFIVSKELEELWRSGITKNPQVIQMLQLLNLNQNQLNQDTSNIESNEKQSSTVTVQASAGEDIETETLQTSQDLIKEIKALKEQNSELLEQQKTSNKQIYNLQQFEKNIREELDSNTLKVKAKNEKFTVKMENIKQEQEMCLNKYISLNKENVKIIKKELATQIENYQKSMNEQMCDLQEDVRNVKNFFQELSSEIKDIKQQLITKVEPRQSTSSENEMKSNRGSNNDKPKKFQKLIDDINHLKKSREIEVEDEQEDSESDTSESTEEERPKFQGLIENLSKIKSLKKLKDSNENNEIIGEVKGIKEQQENISKQLEDLNFFIKSVLGNKTDKDDVAKQTQEKSRKKKKNTTKNN